VPLLVDEEVLRIDHDRVLHVAVAVGDLHRDPVALDLVVDRDLDALGVPGDRGSDRGQLLLATNHLDGVGLAGRVAYELELGAAGHVDREVERLRAGSRT
jgi:hypothetical protein